MMRREQRRGKPHGSIRLALAIVVMQAAVTGDAIAQSGAAQTRPAKPKATYWVYVGAESADLIHRIRFGAECPAGSTPTGPTASGCAVVERTIGAGEMATEAEGPHGLQISRDGKYLHMTTGHGSPDGKYWKYEPTWAQPSANGARVYVACDKSDEILEIDAGTWAVARRFPTGRAPYNLAVTPDGKLLVVTLKAGSGVQVFNLATGKSVMQEKTSITLAHGVTVSAASRYAFVSVEGKGAQPGKVEVFDLTALAKVTTVDVGQQASGITFWKMEPAKP